MPEALPAPTIVMTDIVFPGDTNQYGSMFGGHVMALMDKAAFLATVRFARVPAVTVSSDGIRFLVPIHQGDVIETRARVAYVGRTSAVVKVEVFRERPLDAGSRELATSGWFAMAARDRDNRPIALPPLLLETEQDRADAIEGEAFRRRSLGHGAA